MPPGDVLFMTIMRFIEEGHDENDDLTELREYLKTKGIDIPEEDLKREIELIRLKRDQKLYLERIEALLFTPDGRMKPPSFRYGSAFCPRCGLFKNYEKECPHCGFHEMSI